MRWAPAVGDGGCVNENLVTLAQLGVRVAWAEWLPFPAVLLPEDSLAIIDRGLDGRALRTALSSLVAEALDALHDRCG